ncbi:type II toxin-antitoxin system RelE/ParE family toxin [Flavobacterium sp. PLA-1-15]|uniref:type II toxin-antitoxin system RelE/ParE family toxin n=1 Tax=Flavobacterium sp. PLA-1-15 TaxID=3380533 RepID=UPI003B814C5A
MGKKIIWSSKALLQLEDIHFYILFESKSINIADKVVEKIFESTSILKEQSEIYKVDTQKKPKDPTFRAYYVYDFKISYQITETNINILRVRHTARKPRNL